MERQSRLEQFSRPQSNWEKGFDVVLIAGIAYSLIRPSRLFIVVSMLALLRMIVRDRDMMRRQMAHSTDVRVRRLLKLRFGMSTLITCWFIGCSAAFLLGFAVQHVLLPSLLVLVPIYLVGVVVTERRLVTLDPAYITWRELARFQRHQLKKRLDGMT